MKTRRLRSETLLIKIGALQEEGKLPTCVTRAQLIDFAYGNTKIENTKITRKIAKEAVDKLLLSRE